MPHNLMGDDADLASLMRAVKELGATGQPDEDEEADAIPVISLPPEEERSPASRVISKSDASEPRPLRVADIAPASTKWIIEKDEPPPPRVVETPSTPEPSHPAPPAPPRLPPPTPVHIESTLAVEPAPDEGMAGIPRIHLADSGDLASITRAVEELATAKQQREADAKPTLVESAQSSLFSKDGGLHKTTMLALLGLFVIIAVAVGVAIFPYVYKQATRRNVPDVIGQQVIQAQTTLTKMGYKVNIAIFDVPKAAGGTVFDMTPAVGSIVHVGDTLTLLVVTDTPSPEQPLLAGHTTPRFLPTPPPGKTPPTRAVPIAANASPTPAGSPPNGQPGAPTVAGVNPVPAAPPQLMGSGKTTDHANPAPSPAPPAASRVSLPDVKGMPEAHAKALLALMGLRPVTANVVDPSQPNGVVLTCHPAAGTLLDAGANVYLLINGLTPAAPKSTAPSAPTLTLKNYVGKTGREAADELYQLGLTPAFVHQSANGATPNTVIATDPPAGAAVPIGATVKVVLAL